jgi:hypothetical protein
MGRVDRQVGRQFYHRHSVAGSLLAPVDTDGAGKLRNDDFFANDIYASLLATASGMAFEILKCIRIGFYLVRVDDDDSLFKDPYLVS